ncbi:FMN-binding protein MioC [Neiella marina]|uniref:FMN-binding protein MioC n=1 Tax=Neiella holothuriorum TaxID=2870530 RepID=A0ABS7EC38_9GAMM|nr:FMN-binding protein MioC [Neiella holothuriorum]MBW8189810.1 FMN-binding protein MioC [Neiella holothuriorum]
MTKINIMVGTMLGGSEYVADCLADDLKLANLDSTVHSEFNDLADYDLNDIWLICTSTHGAGDLPDNIEPLAELLRQQPDLSSLHYGVIGIGDTSYDTFNQAAKTLDQLLQQCQANRLGEPLYIDVQANDLPEEPAQQWLKSWIEQNSDKLNCG